MNNLEFDSLYEIFVNIPPYTLDVRIESDSQFCLWQCARPLEYLNVVRRLDAGGEDLERYIEYIHRYHGATPSCVSIPAMRYNSMLRRNLEQIGYQQQFRAIAATRPSTSERGGTFAIPDIRIQLVKTPAALRDFLRVDAQVFGDSNCIDEAEYTCLLQNYLKRRSEQRCFVAYCPKYDEPIGCGRLYLSATGELALLQASGTVPHYRSRGVYRALVDARMRYANAIGISQVGLFAKSQSSAPIVERMGFKACGELWHWSALPFATRSNPLSSLSLQDLRQGDEA